jgi:hypothetical protein
MSEAPKQPRNAEVVSKDGQFNQAHARWWDATAKRAYSAIQSFNEFIGLDTLTGSVDTANDYIMVYDASAGAAKKVLVEDAVPNSEVLQRLTIETIPTTSGGDWVSATIDTASLKAAGYRDLLIDFKGVSFNFGTRIDVRVSDDNGSSYPTGIYYGYTRRNDTSFTREVNPDYIRLVNTDGGGGTFNGTVSIMDAFEDNTNSKTASAQTAAPGTTNRLNDYQGFIRPIGAINRIYFEVVGASVGDAGSIVIYAR